jgi:hypothetical protein
MQTTRKRIQSSQQLKDGVMVSLKLHALVIWLHAMGAWVPVSIAVVGIAIFACCAFGCGVTPCKEKDRLFRREVY